MPLRELDPWAALRGYSTVNPDAATTLLDHATVPVDPTPVHLLCALLSALGGKEITPPEPGKGLRVELVISSPVGTKKVVA